MTKPTLHVLTGPTAVGKTEWALRWAERNGAEIVSCDSLLFYRGMDIGTAKPSPAELTRVRHHLIDICDVHERMDVARYVALARAAIDEIAGRGRPVLVTGGSGFYLKSFFAPVADDIDVPESLRNEVGALSPAAALARLQAMNPKGLGTLDTANPRRVTRALERCLVSGRPLLELRAEFEQRPAAFADFDMRLTILHRDAADLAQRVRSRVAEMVRSGLVEEVQQLRAAGLEQNPSAAKAIGYREVLAVFAGALPESLLVPTIVQNTLGLVKKQRTWFRTQVPLDHRLLTAAELQPGDEARLFD